MEERYIDSPEGQMTYTGKKALIIDDSRVNQNVLMNCLEENGFETVSANDGVEGLEKFKSIRPSLTFLDIVMPKMSGLEVLQRIKAFDPSAKVIMVTSLVSKQILKQAKELNADWFLRKPFNESHITDIIQRFDDRK